MTKRNGGYFTTGSQVAQSLRSWQGLIDFPFCARAYICLYLSWFTFASQILVHNRKFQAISFGRFSLRNNANSWTPLCHGNPWGTASAITCPIPIFVTLPPSPSNQNPFSQSKNSRQIPVTIVNPPGPSYYMATVRIELITLFKA